MSARDQFLCMLSLLKAVAFLVCTVKTVETKKPCLPSFFVFFQYDILPARLNIASAYVYTSFFLHFRITLYISTANNLEMR
uniref:Secreted protein n=1 Tax=Ixodes ricinus TaxID=34613 RepID=A0A6B0U5F1_IXORI